MEWLTYGTYLAGALLCFYLFVLVAVFGALFYFTAQGAGWVNRKLDDGLTKANDLARTADGAVTRGLNAAAEPQVRGAAAASAAGTFVRRLLGR